jgi:hypothetical protein
VELNPKQFANIDKPVKPKVKQLNPYVKKLYPQIAEQLTLLIRQAKLEKLKQNR